MSHIAAITQLRSLDRSNDLWFASIVAYSLGGIFTSFVIGLVLGAIPLQPSTLVLLPVICLALPLVARELGFLEIRLPQVNRQTHKMWVQEFGFVTGAGMWGAHIGIGFATVVRHGGFYMVVLAAVLSSPITAAMIYTSYWIGRTLPIWVAPLAMGNASLSRTSHLVSESSSVYRAMATAAIVFAAVAIGKITLGY